MFNEPLQRYLKPDIKVYPKEEAEFGVEVEVEGKDLAQKLVSYWKCEHDGSLRGEAIEYIFKKPLTYQKTKTALEYLRKKLDKNGSIVYDSDRTSVHVHVNMSYSTLMHVYNMIVLYGIFEELMTEYAGETRVGNLFCLRMQDAEYFVLAVKQAARSKNLGVLNTDDLRYCALNVRSLFKYGTLEFRALRGTVDPDVIMDWIDLITCIRDKSEMYADPSEIMSRFSQLGPRAFLLDTFGGCSDRLRVGDWKRSMQEGVRTVQDIAFCTDWQQQQREQMINNMDKVLEEYPRGLEPLPNQLNPRLDRDPRLPHPIDLDIENCPPEIREDAWRWLGCAINLEARDRILRNLANHRS